jgi:plastocyanin
MKHAAKLMGTNRVKLHANPLPINIQIEADAIGGQNVYNFSYDPATVHVAPGTKLEFHVSGVPLTKAWVVFDVPVAISPFYVQVVPAGKDYVAAVDQPGAHHYQFIGLHTNGDLVADVYCPSVIVH